jgi:heme/copper-type cytochrome/quinol oxidase subunit 2
MEWLWWALLLVLVIGWPVLFTIVAVIRRRSFSSRSAHDAQQRIEDARA